MLLVWGAIGGRARQRNGRPRLRWEDLLCTFGTLGCWEAQGLGRPRGVPRKLVEFTEAKKVDTLVWDAWLVHDARPVRHGSLECCRPRFVWDDILSRLFVHRSSSGTRPVQDCVHSLHRDLLVAASGGPFWFVCMLRARGSRRICQPPRGRLRQCIQPAFGERAREPGPNMPIGPKMASASDRQQSDSGYGRVGPMHGGTGPRATPISFESNRASSQPGPALVDTSQAGEGNPTWAEIRLWRGGDVRQLSCAPAPERPCLSVNPRRPQETHTASNSMATWRRSSSHARPSSRRRQRPWAKHLRRTAIMRWRERGPPPPRARGRRETVLQRVSPPYARRSHIGAARPCRR